MSAPMLKTVEVLHGGWREVFEVGARRDGSFLVVNVTYEERPIARIFPGPWVHQNDVAGRFHIMPHRLAEKAAEALTEAMGGEA